MSTRSEKSLTSIGKFALGTVMFMLICLAIAISDILSVSSSAVMPNDMAGVCRVSYVSTDMLPTTGEGNSTRNIYSIEMPDGQVIEGYGAAGDYIPQDGEYAFTGTLRSDGGYNITVDSSYIPNTADDIHEASRAEWDDDKPSVSQVISDFTWNPSEDFLAQEGTGNTGVAPDGGSNPAEGNGAESGTDESEDATSMSERRILTLDDKLAISTPESSRSAMKVTGQAVDSVSKSHEGCADERSAIEVDIDYENLFANHPVTVIAALIDVKTGEVLKNEDGIEIIAADDKLLDDFYHMLASVVEEAPASTGTLPTSEELAQAVNESKQGGTAKMSEAIAPIESVYRYAYEHALPICDTLPPLQQIADACERIHVAGAYATLGDGRLSMEIPVDAKIIAGKTIAVQAELSTNGNLIAQLPADLADGRYKVSYPSIDTEATVRGEHGAAAEPGTVVIDTVKYSNLSVGTLYHVESTVLDRDSMEPVTDPRTGEEVTYITEFSPATADGTFNVIFPEFDSSGLRGRNIVVEEKVHRCGEEDIVGGARIHSSEKSILVAKSDTESPESMVEFNKDISLAETGVLSSLEGLPLTGGDLRLIVFGIIALSSLVAVMIVLYRRERR